VVTYDIDGNQIVPYTYMKFTGATDTTLAAQLNPGDTTVTLTDATGWQNATGAGGYQRNFVWYGYTNSFGYTYPDYTYSRNVSNSYSDFNTNGAWAAGGISGNVITLRAAWTGPTVPAGTAVRNNTSGGTYKYIAASNVDVPDTWTQYTGLIGGWDTTGTNSPNLFPYGSSYVKLLFLLNRNVAGNTTNVSDLWFSELTANNIEVATTTQQGVVSTTTQSFAGDKTFTAVNAASGSANALTLSGTLGAFNGSDTFRGLYLNYTNANHTSTSNVFNGVDIAAITGDADATETAVAIGSGWDNVLTVNGTTVINGSGQIVSTQITGTIFNTSADSGSSTLVQNDTFAINGGTNGIDTVLSGDTYTLNLDTTEIGASTFGSGTPYTWVFDAGATDPTISFGDNSIAIASAVLSVNTLSLTGTGTLNGLDAIDATGETTLEAALDIAGDVTGTGLGAVTVAKINGATLGTTTATAGNLLIGSGTDWVSTALSGDITVDSAGVTSVAADSLNFADFVDAMALDANTTIAANHINTLTMTSTLTSGRTTYPMIISQANDATNNNSVGLLQLSNSDTASTAAVLNITQAATSGTGINFTSLTGGTSITVANTSGTAINANTITSGTGLTTTALTSGQAVVAGLPNGATTASALSVTSSAAGITANYTGAVINIAPTRTMTAAATRDESGNYLKIARNVVTTGASSVYNITGALATFTNTGTQTAGTLTDSSNILNLAQNYASASGTVLNITGAGTGNLASLDASNSSANGVLIDVQSSSASQYAFRVTSNNASTQALSITGAGNVGIGTTAPSGKLDVTDTSNTAASFSLTNNTATTIGNGANTLGVLDLQSTTLTTGNFLNMELNALTTGKGINLTSTSTTLTSGNLVNLYWNPGSSATSTGDLFKINVGANALTNGNLFALYNNGTELFSVDTTKITSALPHEFTAAGDVSFAYDSIYTNQTASQIEAYGPLTIISGEVSESLDLTLKSYGTGAIVVDNSALELYTGEKLVFDTNDTGDSYLSHSNGGNYTSIFTDGVEVARFMADGSVDGNTTFDANQFDIAEYYPTIDPTVEAGDVVSLVSDLNETDLETSSYLIAKADPSVQNNVLGVISTKPGFSMGGGSFRSEFCALVLSGEEGENKARKDLFMKEIKESLLKGEFIVEGLDINSIEVDNEVAKLYDEYISTLEDGSISLNIPETRLATIEDRISSCKAEKQIPVALAGRVPVKIDTSNGAIKAGDLLAPSINSVGKAMKATAEGWVIGRALENHKEGNDTVMVYVFTSWYGGDSSSVIDNSQSLSLDGALKNMLSVSISADGKQNLGVAGNITSIGSVNSFNLTATGSVNAGLIRIDAMQNSISALGNKLYLQKENGSLDIDIFNGKLVMSPDGSLVSASTIQAKAVSSNEFKVLGAKSNGQDSSIGADILPAGKTSVVIENAYVKTNSKVFVTPTTRTDGQVLFIESKQDGKFTVVIESSVSKDIKFDYWIVQTEE